ncbi:pentapeptide repeat-containing protein [Streptomyces sp. Ac-502]|uniref:pentapeptide repeat-containing protein n=1 Tax=Streptomyces sp. Ac-502 TaxID=3342801 RepID=UPI0038627A84
MDWARRVELFTVVVAAVVAVAGLWYSNVQTRQAHEQAQQANSQAREDRAPAEEGQITDRYTAAVGNLGEDKMDVRLGGIYALQRIMQDSRRDQPTIANVLATYIRTHATEAPKGLQSIRGLPADIQAASTVLVGRDVTRDGAFRLVLTGAKLPGLVSEGTAETAMNLRGADLTGADLRGADLLGADLTAAYMNGADLSGADLRGADLRGADLRGADLTGARKIGLKLRHAELYGVKGLTRNEIDAARAD